eukprot:ctg_7073.g499
MQRKPFKVAQDFTTPGTVGRRYRQQDFLGSGGIDHALNVPWLVHLKSGNYPVRNTVIIINEGYRPHDPAHTQGSDQLIAC